MLPDHLAARLGSLEPVPTGVAPVLPGQLGVEAILFDVYGTLFISGSGDISLARSENRAGDALAALLLKYGIDTDPGIFRKRFFKAIEDSHAASRQKGVRHPEVEIDNIWQTVAEFEDPQRARAFAIEYEVMVNPVGPMPHLSELLAACRHAGIPMGIISNAQFFTPLLFEWFLDRTPATLGFTKSLLFYSWQWGLAKPAEKLFQEARRRLTRRGIAPGKTLYIGNDMLNDIVPARSTGFQTALFAGDKRSLRLRAGEPRCSGIEPDMVVTDLIQLVDFLKNK